MKLRQQVSKLLAVVSHPARGAWIEIAINWLSFTNKKESHPARGAWIEIILYTSVT